MSSLAGGWPRGDAQPRDQASRVRSERPEHQKDALAGMPVLLGCPPGLVIDVRDLAAWLVSCAEAGTVGTFSAAGEPMPLTDHLDVARAVVAYSGPVVPPAPDWLKQHCRHSWMAQCRCFCGLTIPAGTA